MTNDMIPSEAVTAGAIRQSQTILSGTSELRKVEVKRMSRDREIELSNGYTLVISPTTGDTGGEIYDADDNLIATLQVPRIMDHRLVGIEDELIQAMACNVPDVWEFEKRKRLREAQEREWRMREEMKPLAKP